MQWLWNQKTTTKIDIVKCSESKWQMSRNRILMKVLLLDGTLSYGERYEDSLRAIEFNTQLYLVTDANWTRMLAKQHDRKLMLHDILQ